MDLISTEQSAISSQKSEKSQPDQKVTDLAKNLTKPAPTKKEVLEDLLKSEQKFQLSETIPTHKQLKAGITSDFLKEQAALKKSGKNKRTLTFVGVDDNSNQTNKKGNHLFEDNENDVFQTDEGYALIKKQAKLSKKEKSHIAKLSIQPVLIDSKLTAKGIAFQREQTEKITDHLQQSKLRKLFDTLDEQQKDRYEFFKRSNFNKPGVKKIMAKAGNYNSLSINSNVTIAVCGVTKIFIGQVIEKAVEVRDRRDKIYGTGNKKSSNASSSPIHPSDIREAVRLLKNDSNCYTGPSSGRFKKNIFLT